MPFLGLSNFVNKSDRRRPQPPNLEILKLAKPAKKYKLQSCILGNPRLSTNQQCRTEEPKPSREKTKKQWRSSNSRFASVQISDGAGIHRHAEFKRVAYTRKRGGSKNLTQPVNIGFQLAFYIHVTWISQLRFNSLQIGFPNSVFQAPCKALSSSWSYLDTSWM